MLQGGGLSSGREQPDLAATDAWGLGGATDAAWLSQHDGGQPTAEQAADGSSPAAEVTWELILQWADYYRSQGSTEEELRAWIATSYPAFAHHLADLPAIEGASGWAQQQQQQQHNHDGTREDGEAGQPMDGTQGNKQAALHPADASVAAAETRDSTPGPDRAVQPPSAGFAEASRVQSSTHHEVPPAEPLKQEVGRPQSNVQGVVAEHFSSTGHTDDANTTGMVRRLALKSSVLSHRLIVGEKRCLALTSKSPAQVRVYQLVHAGCRAGWAGARHAGWRCVCGRARLGEHRVRQADGAPAVGRAGGPLRRRELHRRRGR